MGVFGDDQNKRDNQRKNTFLPLPVRVHPLLATSHAELAPEILSPGQRLCHAVVCFVPPCIFHQCQSNSGVYWILSVRSCHSFILKSEILFLLPQKNCLLKIKQSNKIILKFIGFNFITYYNLNLNFLSIFILIS